jgi:CysZ protein
MWPLLLGPGLIGLLYFPLVAFLTFRYGGRAASYLRDHWLPEFLKQKFLFFLVTVALLILGLYLGFVLFRNVVMVLYAPVLSYLSRKTEEKLTPGALPPQEPASMLKGAVRGITMSLTSLAIAIACFFVCVGMLVVPVIGQISMALLLPLSQMFLAGHGFMDPTLERRHIGVGQSFRFTWRHRYHALGCGAMFVLLAMIPIVGWFLAPTLGIVAGTLIALDTTKNERQGVIEV